MTPRRALWVPASFGLLCLAWQLAAARVACADGYPVSPPVRVDLRHSPAANRVLAFGVPPGATRPGTPATTEGTNGSSASPTAGPPPTTVVPAAPTYPVPEGYPPPGSYPPPGGYPPSGGYPPPGGYAPPAYPAGGYPPQSPSSPPGSYPYPQPGYPPNYYYPPAPPPGAQGLHRGPGAETHDGFYLRMQLGISRVDVKGKAPGATVTYGDGGASAGLALGYTVAPHLTLYLDFLIAGAASSTPRVSGSAQTGSQLGADVYGLGPGLSFDFGPDFFASATVLLATVRVTDANGDTVAKSKSGAGIELQLGKEWWVCDNWGIGMSGQFIYGSMKGSDRDPTLFAVPDWRVVTLAGLFSATYN